MARILVIDDHDTLREGMAVTLTRSGHTVTAAVVVTRRRAAP